MREKRAQITSTVLLLQLVKQPTTGNKALESDF